MGARRCIHEVVVDGRLTLAKVVRTCRQGAFLHRMRSSTTATLEWSPFRGRFRQDVVPSEVGAGV